MKHKKACLAAVLGFVLLIGLYARFFADGSVHVRYAGRWWGVARSIYYQYDRDGRNRIIGRNISVGPIAVDYFYADVTIVTNASHMNR